MKKLFLSLIISAVCFQFASAQAMTTPNGLGLDSVASTATKSLTIPQVKTDGSISFIFTITKISGTVGGTAVLEASINNTDWVSIATSYTVTDATQTAKFEVDKIRYPYYRIKITGSSGQNASFKGQYHVKRAVQSFL